MPIAPDLRTPLADASKRALTDAFALVPEGKRGALVVLADEHGARAVLAAKFGTHWKVALGGETPWAGHPITGSVAVVGAW